MKFHTLHSSRIASSLKVALATTAIAVCALLPSSPVLAEPTFGTALSAIQWWMKDGGPRLQRALGHKGFRAARPGVPIYIENATDKTVVFWMESKSCSWWKETLVPGQSLKVWCNTTSGDNWYNVRFGSVTYGLDAATVQVFGYGGDDELNLFDETPERQ